jgi:hypothetical protein
LEVTIEINKFWIVSFKLIFIPDGSFQTIVCPKTGAFFGFYGVLEHYGGHKEQFSY